MPNCKIFYNIISDGEETAFAAFGDFLCRNDAYNIVFYTTEDGKKTKNSYAVFPDKVVFSRVGETSYIITLKKGVEAESVIKSDKLSLPFSAALKSFSYTLCASEFSFDLSYDINITSMTLNNRVLLKAVFL